MLSPLNFLITNYLSEGLGENFNILRAFVNKFLQLKKLHFSMEPFSNIKLNCLTTQRKH